MMEKALEKLAEQILSFDEASLVHLREKYRLRIEHFDGRLVLTCIKRPRELSAFVCKYVVI